MANRLPIITTKYGMEGIKVKNNIHAIVTNYQDLAQDTVSLLKNKKLQAKIGDNASKLVKKEYSWAKSAAQLNKIYQKVISK